MTQCREFPTDLRLVGNFLRISPTENNGFQQYWPSVDVIASKKFKTDEIILDFPAFFYFHLKKSHIAIYRP